MYDLYRLPNMATIAIRISKAEDRNQVEKQKLHIKFGVESTNLKTEDV
jgi:hypothetical protein